MAAAARAAARDSALRRIETYTRPQGRTRAVPLVAQSGFAFQLRRWRREARPHRPGPGVRFKVSRAGERMGSKQPFAGRSAVPRYPRFQAGREVPGAPDCEAATGKRGSKVFVRLGWSSDKPEASDASWGTHWRRPQIRPTQPRKELTWRALPVSRTLRRVFSVLAATSGLGCYRNSALEEIT